MEAFLSLISQSAPVIASIMAGVWFLSNKFNVVEKKCDLIAQKVDFLGGKVEDLENSSDRISNTLHVNSEKFSENISQLDRRIFKIEITHDNKKEKSA